MSRATLAAVAVAALALAALIVFSSGALAPQPAAVREAKPAAAEPTAPLAPGADALQQELPAATTTPAAPAAVDAALPAAPPAPTAAELEAAAAALRAALVNIICIAPSGGPLHSISASGVIISPSGYVLTSAHVAASFLFADQGVSCVLRAGDPATAAYTARLAYLPSAWVQSSASVLAETAPLGTGERDFALLAITGSATRAPLPPRYPFVALARAAPSVGASVVVGSYGAQSLSLAQIESALSPTIAASSVKQLLTFATSTPDVLALGGSAAAQEGSSGGGALGALDRTLLGSLTTSTVTGSIASRTLTAVSAAYIRREFQVEAGLSLDQLLATSPADAVAAFAPEAATLEAQILAALAH